MGSIACILDWPGLDCVGLIWHGCVLCMGMDRIELALLGVYKRNRAEH